MQHMNTNLALIVFKLMTSHRGWRVDELMRELDIKDRTYRKYRLRLQEEFEPLTKSDGTSLIQEVVDGDARYLRVVNVAARGWADEDFIARVAALHFAARIMRFLEGTELGDAIDAFLCEFTHSMRDRKTLLGDVLNHANRMFYEIPDAPKDYSAKGEIIHTILRAMLLCKRVEVEYDSASLRGAWEMTLEPLTLASHRSALYVIARAKGYEDIRMYAVDRILRAEALAEQFEYPSVVKYDPDTYIGGSWGLFRGEEGEQHEFDLVFTNKRWLKMFLQERRWHDSQRFEELDDGRLRMTFTVTSDREVWPWIRGFGDDVEVRSPTFEPPVSEADQA